jgi:putative transcription factor
MMLCELCGRETKNLIKVLVERTTMEVCEGCAAYGKILTEPTKKKTPIKSSPRKYQERDIFEGMDTVLVPNWAKKIKTKREKKGLTREQLGAAIGQRTITIAHLENGELHPTDEMARKIERELNIVLLEKITSAGQKTDTTTEVERTIGDLLGHENNQS